MYNNICSIVGDADSSSHCSGVDLWDPASIYWSDDDDDLDGIDDGSWEISEGDQNGHQWNTPPSKHQMPPHVDGDDDLDGDDDESWENSEGGQDIHRCSAPPSNNQNPTHGDDGDDSYCEQNDQNAFYDSFFWSLCLQILIT